MEHCGKYTYCHFLLSFCLESVKPLQCGLWVHSDGNIPSHLRVFIFTPWNKKVKVEVKTIVNSFSYIIEIFFCSSNTFCKHGPLDTTSMLFLFLWCNTFLPFFNGSLFFSKCLSDFWISLQWLKDGIVPVLSSGISNLCMNKKPHLHACGSHEPRHPSGLRHTAVCSSSGTLFFATLHSYIRQGAFWRLIKQQLKPLVFFFFRPRTSFITC